MGSKKVGINPRSQRWLEAEQWLWARYFGSQKLALFPWPTASHLTHSGKCSTWASEDQSRLVRREFCSVAAAQQWLSIGTAVPWALRLLPLSWLWWCFPEVYLGQWLEPLKLSPLCRCDRHMGTRVHHPRCDGWWLHCSHGGMWSQAAWVCVALDLWFRDHCNHQQMHKSREVSTSTVYVCSNDNPATFTGTTS